MKIILENLKGCTNRSTTSATYLCIWRKFNEFIIKLDDKPDSWEDRATLFGAYLIKKGVQSATLKSYMSAIKKTLINDGYHWRDEKVLFNTLTKSCRLINDKVRTRLPININLLELLLFEVERQFDKQYYLEILYKTVFLLGYYGLLRIGEMAKGDHPILAKDVHIAQNKDKLLFILYTSKTHGIESIPQEIKITSNRNYNNIKKNFCPFKTSREFLAIRGNYKTENEPFFVFQNRMPVTPSHVRTILKDSIARVNLDPNAYNCHSLRIGRASDLLL